MGRVLRGALVVVVIVVVVAAVAAGGLLGAITASGQPQQSGTIHVPGLAADTIVSRDVSGVTHIAAGTSHDLFFAQGWVHASERMWQMEVWRRIGAGRLAELFGESQVATDSFIRTVDWRGAAERDLAALSDETRSFLDAYADGVNAFLEGHPNALGLSFVVAGALAGQGTGLAGLRPEPWTPIDTLTWAKVQAWGLGRQPGQRDLPDAGRCPAGRPRAHGRTVPGLRPRPAGHRGPGDRAGDHPPDRRADGRRQPERDPRRWRLDGAAPASRTASRPGRADPRDGPGGQGWRRLQQLGRGPVPLGHRRRAPRQRPAPRLQHAVGLVRQRPALPAHLGRLPVRRRGRHLPRHPRRDRRPQRSDRVGRDQRQPRCPGPRRGEGRSRRSREVPHGRRLGAVHGPHRDDRRRGRRGRHSHGPRNPPRADRSRTWTTASRPPAPRTPCAGRPLRIRTGCPRPSSTSTGPPTGRHSAPPSPSSERRRRTSSTPTPTVTSATSCRARSLSARSPPTSATGPSPAGTASTSGSRTSRSTICRVSSTRRPAGSRPPTTPCSPTRRSSAPSTTAATAPPGSWS